MFQKLAFRFRTKCASDKIRWNFTYLGTGEIFYTIDEKRSTIFVFYDPRSFSILLMILYIDNFVCVPLLTANSRRAVITLNANGFFVMSRTAMSLWRRRWFQLKSQHVEVFLRLFVLVFINNLACNMRESVPDYRLAKHTTYCFFYCLSNYNCFKMCNLSSFFELEMVEILLFVSYLRKWGIYLPADNIY